MGSIVSSMEQGMQRRTELLLGVDNLKKIQAAKVLIFGIGGVGSWCAESLVRSGIRNITIVDSDRVCVTNCNRQLVATSKTVGQVKVEVLKARLLDINPNANIVAHQKIYEAESADFFHLEDYDYIVDAIDSLKDKVDLILRVTSLPKSVTLVSSMGAALRRDPFKVRMAEFWKVKGDPLARAIRKRFKQQKTFPARDFQCVYSEEPPMENLGINMSCGTDVCVCKNKVHSVETPANTTDSGVSEDKRLAEHDWNSSKAQINGSLCFITATFGMAISGVIINHIIDHD